MILNFDLTLSSFRVKPIVQAHSGMTIIVDALVHIHDNAEEKGANGEDDAENLREKKLSILNGWFTN